MLKKILSLVLVAVVVIGLMPACGKKLGEALIDETTKALEEATDSLNNALEQASDSLEKATEEVEKAVEETTPTTGGGGAKTKPPTSK